MSIPTVGLATQTPATAGQAIDALDVNLSGGYIYNPLNAPGLLYVDPTGPAALTANGTTTSLQPGQSFYAISQSTVPVSVASSYPNHQFICVQWK